MSKLSVAIGIIALLVIDMRVEAQLSTDEVDRIIENEQGGAVSSFNKALTLETKGQKLQAIEAYKQAVRVNPRFKEAYNNLAAIYADLGMFDKALMNYRKAISLDDGYALAHYNLGMTFYALGRYHEAITAFEKGEQLAPNDKDCLYFLGRAFSHVEQYEKAAMCFEKVLAFDREFYPAHFDLAALYMITNKFNKAHEHFKMVLLLAPNHEQAEKIRAIIKDIEKLDLDRVEVRGRS